jgi:hypothetical protein
MHTKRVEWHGRNLKRSRNKLPFSADKVGLGRPFLFCASHVNYFMMGFWRRKSARYEVAMEVSEEVSSSLHVYCTCVACCLLLR